MDTSGMMENLNRQTTRTIQTQDLTQSVSLHDTDYLNQVKMPEEELEKEKKKVADERRKEAERKRKGDQFLQKHNYNSIDGADHDYVQNHPVVQQIGDREHQIREKILTFKNNFSNEKMTKPIQYMAQKLNKKDAAAINYDFYNAAVNMNYLACYYGVDNAPINIDTGKAIDAITRLYTVSWAYLNTHSGNRLKNGSTDRHNASKNYVDLVSSFAKQLTSKEEEEEITGRGPYNEINVDPKSRKKYVSDMNEAVDAIESFEKYTVQTVSAKSAEEVISDKLVIYRSFDRAIRLYRFSHPENEWTDKKRKIIREYETLLRLEKIIQFRKNLNVQGGANLESAVRDHILKEDKKRSNYQINDPNIDEGLSAKQLEGIEKIDHWLICNANNGGILGTIAKSLKNNSGNFVISLLKKSKRERLFIYYLVESDQRKNPNFADIGVSQQSYTPDVNAFAKKMKASPLKVYARITGGYTYMHKLSEACQISDQSKRFVETTSKLQNNRFEQPQGGAQTEEERIINERVAAYAVVYNKLVRYKAELEIAQNAPAQKKKAAEADAKKLAEEVRKDIVEMARKDDSLRKQLDTLFKNDRAVKESAPTDKFDEMKDTNNFAKKAKFVFGTVPSKLTKTIADKIEAAHEAQAAENNWQLDESWADAKLWTGGIAASLTTVSSLLTCLSSIISLFSHGDEMTLGKIYEHYFKFAHGGLDLAKTGAQLMDASSNITKGLGAASCLMNGGLAINYTVDSVVKLKKHKSMDAVLKDKRENKNISELEKKMDKGITKLTEDVIKRKITAATCHYAMATAGVLSVVIPGVPGTIFAVVGGIQSLATTIIDNKMVSKMRKNMIDIYYNIDQLIPTVISLKKQNGINPEVYKEDNPEKLKECLRYVVSSAAGFGNTKAASEYVAAEYAAFIHDKLFGKNKARGAEKQAYIKAVNIIGLDYVEEYGYPTENMLYEYMTQ